MRPSSGVVGTGQRQAVELQLCDGVAPQHIITDRFLVVAAPVPHERVPARDMGRLWRVSSAGEHLANGPRDLL